MVIEDVVFRAVGEDDRGRLLISSWTAATCRGGWAVRLVPWGKHWRSTPLAFSLDPRRRGASPKSRLGSRGVAVMSKCRATTVPIPGDRASNAGARSPHPAVEAAYRLGASRWERCSSRITPVCRSASVPIAEP